MTVVAGVDGGATRTRCVVTDDKDRFCGMGLAGGSNHLLIGPQRAAQEIAKAFHKASGSLQGQKVDLACLCLAGAGRARDKKLMGEMMHELKIAERVIVEDDGIAALYGATGGENGVVIVAGTGAIAYGLRDGKRARAGGWGHIIDDEGGGYYISVKALSAVFRARDGRMQKTSLGRRLIDAVKVNDLDELLAAIYRGMGKREIANLCYHVKETANEGDSVALKIMEEAGKELGGLVSAVIKRLGMQSENVKVVPLGGVFNTRSELLTCPMMRVVRSIASNAYLADAMYDPVVGAVLLAFRYAGRKIGGDRLRLVQSKIDRFK